MHDGSKWMAIPILHHRGPAAGFHGPLSSGCCRANRRRGCRAQSNSLATAQPQGRTRLATPNPCKHRLEHIQNVSTRSHRVRMFGGGDGRSAMALHMGANGLRGGSSSWRIDAESRGVLCRVLAHGHRLLRSPFLPSRVSLANHSHDVVLWRYARSSKCIPFQTGHLFRHRVPSLRIAQRALRAMSVEPSAGS